MRWAHRGIGFVFVMLCVFPIMLVSAFITERSVLETFLTALPGFVVASTLNAFFTKRYRLIGLLTLVTLNVGLGFALYKNAFSIMEPALMLLAQIAVLGFSAQFDKNPVTFREFSVGAGLYGAAYIIFYLSLAQRFLPLLGVFCAVYMVYAIILMNYNAISDAGYLSRKMDGGNLSSGLRGGNIVLTLAFLAAALVMINIGAIKDAVLYAAGQIIFFVLWLFSLGGGESSAGGGGGSDGDLGLPEGEAKSMPAWLEAIFNVLMYAVVAAALLAFAGLICYGIFKAVKKAIALLRKWLGMQTEFKDGGAGYTDERSKLQRGQLDREEKEARPGFIARLTHRLPKWKDLDDRARVRFAFQLLAYPARQSAPDKTRTARELIENAYLSKERESRKDAFADAYDRARYSEGEISARDAEIARGMTEEK